MKKLLLIITALAFIGCSDDDAEPDGCNCDAKFYVEQSDGVYHIEENMPIDCETGEPTYNPTNDPESYFVGCVEETE